MKTYNIALVYDSLGQYDNAIKHFEQALAIAKKLGMEGEIAEYHNNMVLCINKIK